MDINVTSDNDDNSFVTPAASQKPPKKSKKRKLISRQWIMVAIAFLIFIAAAGTAYYFYNEDLKNKKEIEAAQAEIERLSDTEQVAKEEQEQLINQVGQLVELPTNETPTVATVTDINRLKNQAFFADAQNGDKLLIFTREKKAYLYRPSTNKIVTIAPLNINSQQNTKK